MTLASNAIFANLLARHADHEALVFSRIAQAVNIQAREHQRDSLAILGSWRFEPVVRRGREASALYRNLLPPSLHQGSYWNEPGLDLYGTWTLVQETAAYRLEANDRYLRLILSGKG